MQQQTYKSDNDSSQKTATTEESSQRVNRSRAAVDEARQMLDEIAGIKSPKRKVTSRRDLGKTIRTVLLAPITLMVAVVKLIFRPFSKADFSLIRELRKFLASPGNFFWFNRLAPQAAQRHFRTSSTEVMTNHARRYAAHIAMLILALVVVIGGGFSGLVHILVSEDAYVGPNGQTRDSSFLVVTGDMHEVYLSSIGTSSTLAPKRIQVYEVKKGDTYRSLAAKNNISVETILQANLEWDPDMELKIGNKLVIPPVSGTLHIGATGDNVGKIAEMYAVDPKVILDFAPNNLKGYGISTPITNGMEIMVPGGLRPERDKMLLYTVRLGDSVKSIAEKFGVSQDTITIKNDIETNQLKSGMQLQILPKSGIQIRVLQGDSLRSIANRYSVPVENIVNFAPNNITANSVLKAGDTLIVPNGIVPPPPPPPPPPVIVVQKAPIIGPVNSNSRTTSVPSSTTSRTNTGTTNTTTTTTNTTTNTSRNTNAVSTGVVVKPAASASRPVTTGRMIWPINGTITTYFGQYIWYGVHRGLDISRGGGTRVIAADGGVVVQAGWNGGYGISVTIAHNNGLYTLYGHFQGLLVSPGQTVYQGQAIGIEGSTGNSTGPHVHFEVRAGGNSYDSTVNPLRYLP